MRPNPPAAPQRQHYQRPGTPAYPRERRERAVAIRVLDRGLREAARYLRSSCTRQPAADVAQRFTDLVKGRHFGSLSIEAILRGAHAAGAPLHAGLQLARAIESFTRAVWREGTRSVPTAVRAETEAQGAADLAQMHVLTSESAGTLDEAIEATAREVTHKQELLAALVARRAEVA